MGIIYLAQNKINGRRYVGQSISTLEKRKKSHELSARYGSPTRFAKAIRRYGIDGFDWKVVFEDVADADLNEFEEDAIRIYQSQHPNGYNLLSGGGQNGRHSEESKQRMSLSQTGKTRSEEFKQKVSAFHKGRKRSGLTRQRQSNARSGIPLSAEHRKKISDNNRMRKYPPGTRANMGFKKGRVVSQATKDNISAALTSPEGNAKLKAASVKNREKRSAALKEYHACKRLPINTQIYLPTAFV